MLAIVNTLCVTRLRFGKIWNDLESSMDVTGQHLDTLDYDWLTFGNENLEEWFLLSARMTHKFVKRSKFFTISFAEHQTVLQAHPVVISITLAYVSELSKRVPFHHRKARLVTEQPRKQKQYKIK